MIQEVEIARLYFNKANAPEKAWSIDFGPRTPEILVAQVRITDGAGETVTDQEADNKTYPCAWIQFENVVVSVAVTTTFGAYAKIEKQTNKGEG
jgi:hypothetical protein